MSGVEQGGRLGATAPAKQGRQEQWVKAREDHDGSSQAPLHEGLHMLQRITRMWPWVLHNGRCGHQNQQKQHSEIAAGQGGLQITVLENSYTAYVQN